jgi:hypothetical protein
MIALADSPPTFGGPARGAFSFDDGHAWARREIADASTAEAEFLRAHDVREMKNSEYNVMRLLRSGGASPESLRRVRRMLPYGEPAYMGAFDHGRAFGRDGRPTMLVGHPYDLDRSDLEILDAIRGLGLTVEVGGRSFYGFGTIQVIVMSPNVDCNDAIASTDTNKGATARS